MAEPAEPALDVDRFFARLSKLHSHLIKHK
jgi:hypothetical protein